MESTYITTTTFTENMKLHFDEFFLMFCKCIPIFYYASLATTFITFIFSLCMNFPRGFMRIFQQ